MKKQYKGNKIWLDDGHQMCFEDCFNSLLSGLIFFLLYFA